MNKLMITVLAGSLLTVSAFAETKIQERKENQQARIAQGVKSGQLTAGETARLETREAKVNKEIRTDRAANGGKLTAGERQQVNRQQNRVSRSIYRQKHDGQVQSR